MKEGKDVLKEYFGEDNLRLAFERYSRTKEPDAKDHYGLEIFKENLDDNIKRLSNILINNPDNYIPARPFKFLYPKKSIGISRSYTNIKVVDSIVYQAIADKIASDSFDFITKKQDFVFSHHLNEDVAEGVKILEPSIDTSKSGGFFFKHWPELHNRYIENRNQIIDDNDGLFILSTDITSFYDSIQHSILKKKLKSLYNVDETVLKILFRCLDAFSGVKGSKTPGIGIPQGPEPSMLLAELMLYDIDDYLVDYSNKQLGFLGYARYVDDIEVYASNSEVLVKILSKTDLEFKKIAVSLNSSKTKISPCNTEKEKKDQKEYFVWKVSPDRLEEVQGGSLLSDLIKGNPLYPQHKIGNIKDDTSSDLHKKSIAKLKKKQNIAKPGSLFDSNITEIKTRLTINDLIDLELPDDYAERNKYIQLEKAKIKKIINNEPFSCLSAETSLIIDKKVLKEIYTKQTELLLRFEVISVVERDINEDFYWETEYLDCWFGIIRLFPAKARFYFNFISKYYVKNDKLKNLLIDLYKKLEHSSYARNKLADILLSDLNFSFNSKELKELNQRYITNDALDEYSRMSFLLFLLIHFPLKDQLFNKILHCIRSEDNFVKEWLLFRLSEKSQAMFSNDKFNSRFLEAFDPKDFAKSIAYGH